MPILLITTPSAVGSELSELRQELQDRGYDYLSSARCDRFINWAYQELCEAYPWPFLEVEAQGTVPLEAPDMRQVLSVTDATTSAPLSYIDRRTLAESVDLTSTGTPVFWYFENNVINTYPVTTNWIVVRYVQVADDLAEDDDLALVPRRYSGLLIDGAVLRAMKDDDNLQGWAGLRGAYDADVLRMCNTLMLRHLDSPDSIVRTEAHEGWY